MFSVIACIRDDHDWRLIVVATVVCLAAASRRCCFSSAPGAAQAVSGASGLQSAPLPCGIGVWSTHFIAMLAYDGGIPIAYGAKGTSFFHRGRDRGVLDCLLVGLAGGSRQCSGRGRFAARARNRRHARGRHACHRGAGTGRIRSGNEFRRRSSRHVDRHARLAFVRGAARRARARRIHPASGGGDMRPALRR